jgi:predicted nucleic acid-binding protein
MPVMRSTDVVQLEVLPKARYCHRQGKADFYEMFFMDLKIAAIVLIHDALLLSVNLRDFQQVPNLRVANWIR